MEDCDKQYIYGQSNLSVLEKYQNSKIQYSQYNHMYLGHCLCMHVYTSYLLKFYMYLMMILKARKNGHNRGI
jgi:hypothetical protein